MNCQNCNTRIDYRFVTNCERCGCAVETEGQLKPNSIPDIQPVESAQKSLSWRRKIVNLLYVLASSVMGMISGAVIVYVGAGLVYSAMYSGVEENPSVACSRGMAVGFLSIVVGAFLGTVGGSAMAVKRPLCKTPLH